MKKKVYGRKLSRAYKARKALLRSLLRALVNHGVIKTTKAKAKFIQGQVDKCVNLAKKQTVASYRRLYGFLGNDRKTAEKFVTIAKNNFAGRPGGYTRTVNLPTRRGDTAKMVKLEWVEEIVFAKDDKAKKPKDKQAKTNKSKAVKSTQKPSPAQKK